MRKNEKNGIIMDYFILILHYRIVIVKISK